MKNHAVNADDKKFREAQARDYKAAEWIRVTFANGNTRMMKRADHNAMKKDGK